MWVGMGKPSPAQHFSRRAHVRDLLLGLYLDSCTHETLRFQPFTDPHLPGPWVEIWDRKQEENGGDFYVQEIHILWWKGPT